MACDVAPVRAATPGAAWEAPTASPEEDPSERRSFWGHSSVLQILLSVCPSQERAPFFNESSGQARSGGTLALAHMVDRDMDALFWWGKQHWVVRCWARCVSLSADSRVVLLVRMHGPLLYSTENERLLLPPLFSQSGQCKGPF